MIISGPMLPKRRLYASFSRLLMNTSYPTCPAAPGKKPYSKLVLSNGPQKSSNTRASRSAPPPCPVGITTLMFFEGKACARAQGAQARAAADAAPVSKRRRAGFQAVIISSFVVLPDYRFKSDARERNCGASRAVREV